MSAKWSMFAMVVLLASSLCSAQAGRLHRAVTPVLGCTQPKPIGNPGPGYKPADLSEPQPDKTADLPSVVQTVEQALECYQALAGTKDPMQPEGLPKLSSVAMDFKTTTGKTVGFSFSVFVFKIGASREKDVTDEVKLTYSVKPATVEKGPGVAKPSPPSLYEELVKDIQAAARAAKGQSTALGMPLNKVEITIAYGIKFDGNVSINVPVQLVTIGGNGDYNKNNTQTLGLTFGQ